MSNRPDPIVREAEVRDSVDRIASGLAEDARAGGKIPDARAIEDFAKQVTDKQVKLHEERARREGIPEKKQAPHESIPDEYLDAGGALHFSRPLGAVDWNTETNEMTPAGRLDPRLVTREATEQDEEEIQAQIDFLRAQREWKSLPRWKQKLLEQRVRLGHFAKPKPGTDRLLTERLKLLMAFPEWEAKIINAYQEGFHASNGDPSIATDYAMKVVETSVNIFGDWRTPKKKDPAVIVGAK